MERIEEPVAVASTKEPLHLTAQTLCEVFQETVAERGGQVALRTLGDAVSITFAEYGEYARRFAGALHTLGLRRGDTMAMMLRNRPEFHLLDAGAIHLGVTSFSVYNTLSVEQIVQQLEDAAPRVFIFEDGFGDRARAAAAAYGQIEQLISLDRSLAGELTYEQLLDLPEDPSFDFDASWRAVEPDDILTLIYTSGTTGPSKGVQLTHRNQLAQCRAVDAASPRVQRTGGAMISYLPVAHIVDRGLTHYGQMYWGTTVTCCPEMTQVFAHAFDARPTVFGGVPRVFEKLQAALEAGFAADPSSDPRRAEDPEAAKAQLRERLGLDRCQSFHVGAAPMAGGTIEFFAQLGIEVCQGWGMSELSCMASSLWPGEGRVGSVGRPLPGLELRIANDGEVLARGPLVMAGYRNLPEKTAEAIDEDGWLHTGDVGRIDEDGFLWLLDRKKELIINAAGKNMSPANIEAHLKSSTPLIGQAVAIGDARPYNVALIVLDPDAARAFASAHGLGDLTLEALAQHDLVRAAVAAGVEEANSHLSRVEQIKRFTILPSEWLPASDELTPTMKLRRRPIAEKYTAEIDALYAASDRG